jgi:hypothetical protein
MITWMASGSSDSRSSMRLARVGNISERSMPSSFIFSMRGSGSKNAGMAFIGSPKSSRLLLPSGLPNLKYSSHAPGFATTENVGFGM